MKQLLYILKAALYAIMLMLVCSIFATLFALSDHGFILSLLIYVCLVPVVIYRYVATLIKDK